MARPLPPPSRVLDSKSQFFPGKSAPLAPRDVVKGSTDKLGGNYSYAIKIALKDHPDAGWCFLTHWKLWEQAELDKAVAEACQVCNEVRMPERRKLLSQSLQAGHTKIEDPIPVVNARSFQDDVVFVEAVMCDRYGFTKLVTNYAQGEIVALIISKGKK